MAVITLGTALALAGISAGLKGVSMGIGARQASKHNKNSEDLIKAEKRQAELARVNAGNNYLETIEGKTIANQGKEALMEATQRTTNNAIKRGGTTEQRLAEAGNWQKAYGNLLSNLASKGTQYRQYYDNLLNNARNKYNNAMIEVNNAKAQSVKNTWDNIGQGIDDLAKAGMTLYANKSGEKQTDNQIGESIEENDFLKKYETEAKKRMLGMGNTKKNLLGWGNNWKI